MVMKETISRRSFLSTICRISVAALFTSVLCVVPEGKVADSAQSAQAENPGVAVEEWLLATGSSHIDVGLYECVERQIRDARNQ